MSSLRLYIIAPTFLPMVGGAERQALAHARALRERGFTTTILTLRYNKSWPMRETIEGVPILRIGGGVLGGRERLLRPLQKMLYLIALLVMSWTVWHHRRSYDVIHLYHLGLEALPVALICWFSRKPLVISVRAADSKKDFIAHSSQTHPLNQQIPDTPSLLVDEQEQREGDLAVLESLGKPAVRFTRFLLRRINAVIIVISSRMIDYLTEHDFLLPRIQRIPNGVDITRFSPSAIDRFSPTTIQQKTNLQVVCVSKLRYQKGIDVLLRAWYLVHAQFPQARLIIVGDGPLQAQLEDMARRLGVAESVEFAGLQRDIAAQLHRGTLAVLSSYWEGMPNALLEAMACGLPCVATRVSGSEDIIQHEVNGLLVEPADPLALAEAMIQLLSHPELAQQYSYAARTTIEKHFSLEYVTEYYVKLYQGITQPSLQSKTYSQPPGLASSVLSSPGDEESPPQGYLSSQSIEAESSLRKEVDTCVE